MQRRRPLRISPLYGRVSRAGEDLDRLNREAQQWHDDCVRVVPHVRTNPAFGDFYAQIVKPPPLVRWGTALGSIIHQLRATLDNLVYCLRVLDSGWRGLNREKLAFPIFNNPGEWAAKAYLTRGLSDSHRAVIQSLQPYIRSHPPDGDPLWRLSLLNNTDKHRVLPLTVFHHAAGRMRIHAPMLGPAQMPVPRFYPGAVEDGTRLASFFLPVVAPGVNVQYEPTFAINVQCGKATLDSDILVRDITKEVLGVLGRFYPDFPD